jgi:23S rRNA (cytosine1962-C5)-methyltransferase
MKTHFLPTSIWPDYELLDSGNGKRLERFGKAVLIRPDPNAIWTPALPQSDWTKADATYEHDAWSGQVNYEPWQVRWDGAVASLRLTPYRHVGLFPEHAVQWQMITAAISARSQAGKETNVLSLFGYTGMASIVAARAGASVCHCDASPGTVRWASENARQSGVEQGIRWIVDDARQFAERELRRGKKYDLILLDPPEFGRGPKGEIWRLGKDIESLLTICNQLLTDDGVVQLTWYATDLYPMSIERIFTSVRGRAGDLSVMGILESSTQKALQTSFLLVG